MAATTNPELQMAVHWRRDEVTAAMIEAGVQAYRSGRSQGLDEGSLVIEIIEAVIRSVERDFAASGEIPKLVRRFLPEGEDTAARVSYVFGVSDAIARQR
jgi:hypothetical protein